LVGRASLDGARAFFPRHGKMGTLEQSETANVKVKFDGTPKSWPAFKEAMLKWADGQGFAYMLEGGHGLCAIFQAASAAAAKKTKGDAAKGMISSDIHKASESGIHGEGDDGVRNVALYAA